ncbi:conserved fungal protein [Coccidioides immitis H538.4]|uniref:Uncharacterized protein n=3 Tax=Coccidioides immitis TaxID=5501 RepID=A0A0J8QZP3_COCIT|nr:conserved fungal protein [Coccidioides immitis RMSCC 2394]KMU77525.1 hypothetical protein CISG_06527 [Coccidioides immitis RMSCC 3703]KMU89087.1 conserved fungal protein [Coccidioides immitis H538.4]
MSKKSVPTDAELLAQFDDLNVGEGTVDSSSSTEPQGAPEQDVLAELQNLASQRPASRPSTPQSKRTSTNTPPADRTSDEKTSSRKSGDSTRPYHMSMTPADTTSSEAGSTPITPDPQAKGSGGGWWGGFFATASAAMKQAEAAVKEIQKNEEAQKWAEHVRGNVGMLKGLGGELKTLALPTFTSFIHTLAPPISSHERLQIHITHDLRGYPSLDSLIYNVFARVMAQVEGGDLLVVQRGQESGPRRGPESGASLKPTAGWNDGPWWRYVSPKQPRSISAIKGAVVATKLARASAEAYANEFYAARGGVEEAARQASEILSESNPVRNSDIFLSIQALSQPVSSELFQKSRSPCISMTRCTELHSIPSRSPSHRDGLSGLMPPRRKRTLTILRRPPSSLFPKLLQKLSRAAESTPASGWQSGSRMRLLWELVLLHNVMSPVEWAWVKAGSARAR